MSSPPNPPGNTSPRRRLGPSLPSGWVWLALFSILAVMLVWSAFGSGVTIDFGDFDFSFGV